MQSSYKEWLSKVKDEELLKELKLMNEEEITDAFYQDLKFGTGGLRGIIGAGTNRMNIYVVQRASQGVSNYLNKNFENPSIAIGYDTRNKSKEFAEAAAKVFAANNIMVNIWPYVSPVPTVSYAVRALSCSAGIMITASHNPKEYNGYKVYGPDGCQITTEIANNIYNEIQQLDYFSDIKSYNKANNTKNIDEAVMDDYISEVTAQSVLFGDRINKDISIVYSPLNGTGYIPVTKALFKLGYTDISLVDGQRKPDSNFTTCPYPNPENKEAMFLGIEYAKNLNADLLMATDPDCDRLGIAVKNSNDEYVLLTGNEVGILLLDYICSQRTKHNKMPNNPVFIKTIVTTDTAKQIADKYGVKTINVLTGFKFIGEQIGILDDPDNFIFGFEESCGYLTGNYVRDKDGVNAACMVCEMFCYYKTQGISLLDKLNELYKNYGYRINSLSSFQFEGQEGIIQIENIMNYLRINKSIGQEATKEFIDYSKLVDEQAKTNMLKFILQDNSIITIRPSGTEPKLKIYISATAENKDKVIQRHHFLENCVKNLGHFSFW